MPSSNTLSLRTDLARLMDEEAEYMTKKNGGIPVSRGALGDSILRPELERRRAARAVESEGPKRGKGAK